MLSEIRARAYEFRCFENCAKKNGEILTPVQQGSSQMKWFGIMVAAEAGVGGEEGSDEVRMTGGGGRTVGGGDSFSDGGGEGARIRDSGGVQWAAAPEVMMLGLNRTRGRRMRGADGRSWALPMAGCTEEIRSEASGGWLGPDSDDVGSDRAGSGCRARCSGLCRTRNGRCRTERWWDRQRRSDLTGRRRGLDEGGASWMAVALGKVLGHGRVGRRCWMAAIGGWSMIWPEQQR